jgi:hypothetical protein
VRGFGVVLGGVLIAYLASYLVVRSMYQATWAKDGVSYVMFPADGVLYYLFRPGTYADLMLTGQHAHLGPHE